MENKNIKLIAFDLDGTLAPSKTNIDEEMSFLLISLMKVYKVAVITGGDFVQFQKQLIPFLNTTDNILSNFYICPTCSSKMYIYKNKEWKKIYSEDLTYEEKNKIFKSFEIIFKNINLNVEKTWGDIIEDRETQITFSALGQNAPLSEKEKWDSDFKKRIKIKEELLKYIPEFAINIGGSTSIDITRKGIDKAFGIYKLSEISDIKPTEIIFIGDAIFEGGNDFPATKTGANCIKTINVENTKNIIKELLK